MSAEIKSSATTAHLPCLEPLSAVRAPPTRPATMRTHALSTLSTHNCRISHCHRLMCATFCVSDDAFGLDPGVLFELQPGLCVSRGAGRVGSSTVDPCAWVAVRGEALVGALRGSVSTVSVI